MRKPVMTLAAVAALLTLVACGDDSESGGDGGVEDVRFNSADVTFAQEMIPHHQQAVQMARMARTHAVSQPVKQLASQIEGAQAPEIQQMSQWLEDWGQEVPGESMSHGDMGHGEPSSAMPGMMDAHQLNALDRATGPRWDRMFLTSMIEHHEGAVEMAQLEQADGQNPQALALAEKIEEDQEAEISEMRDLLSR